MPTPPPPNAENDLSYPGVFIRAPAILSAGKDVSVLGKVVATPCRQAAVVLQELERKIEAGETVVQMGLVDSLERKDSQLQYRAVVKPHGDSEEEKKGFFKILSLSSETIAIKCYWLLMLYV
jgi:hypothetical protein